MTVITSTMTVPGNSEVWGISVVLTPNPPGTKLPAPAPASAQQAAAKASRPIKYAGAVLTGQDDMLASIALCFDSDYVRIKKQRIKKQEDSWVLESSTFAPCMTGEEVLLVADDNVSRINQILAVYADFTPTFSVEFINWIDAEGEPFRTLRDFASLNKVSSKGQAELKGMRGTRPLGSAVFEAMIRDSAVEEALSLHGDGGLSWSQVYDIIDFVGGVERIAKAGYADKKQTRVVRQTANHHRHLGSPRKYPLPPNPPTLAKATEFARSLMKWWICSRF
jgi:hypothetical protein